MTALLLRRRLGHLIIIALGEEGEGGDEKVTRKTTLALFFPHRL